MLKLSCIPGLQRVVICLVILTGAIFSIHASFVDKERQLVLAVQKYQESLGYSKVFLASPLHDLKRYIQDEDGFLKKPNRSAQSRLGFLLKRGEIDRVAIYEKDSCIPLLQASLDHRLPSACHDNKYVADGFIWKKIDEGIPILVARHTISNRKGISLLLESMVLLNHDWLQINQEFEKFHRNLKLELRGMRPGSGSLVFQDGQSENGEFVASLWTKDFSLNLFSGRLHTVIYLLDSLKIPSLLWLIFTCLLSALGFYGRGKILQKRLKVFFLWLKKILSSDILADQHNSLKDFLYADKTFRKSCEEIENMQYLMQRQQKDLLGEYEEGKSQLTKSLKELQYYKDQIGEQEELESLAIHIQQASPNVINRMYEQMEECLDLVQGILPKFLQDNRSLHLLSQEWVTGYQSKGSRKFIRSLCETKGTQLGKHMLEENLEQFLYLSDKLHDQALNFSLKLRKFHKVDYRNIEIINYWKALAFCRLNPRENSSNWDHMISQAKTHLEVHKTDLDLKIKSDHMAGLENPKIPAAVMIMSLYHIFSFFSEIAVEMPLSLIISCKKYRQYTSLFFTFSSKNQKQERIQHENKNIVSVKKLLLPYGFEISLLPGRMGSTSISLAWIDLESKTDKEANKKESATQLTSSV